MLSLRLIDRHFLSKRHHALLEAIVGNGFEVPLPIRARLLQSPAAAIALALRRVLDLTYGPTALSREMVRSLLAQQEPDGSFHHDPIQTATALAGLGRWVDQSPDSASAGSTGNAAVTQACERAAAWLAASQGTDGLFVHPDDRTDEDRALTAAYVLWMLADHATSRATIRWADLQNWFDEHEHTLDDATDRLLQLARATSTHPHAATRPLTNPAAAIAA